MNDVMTQNILIVASQDSPDGEIDRLHAERSQLTDDLNRRSATCSLCTHGEASLSEEGTLMGKIVECPWHFGTFDVTSGKPAGMPCTVALQTFAVKIIEESVYVKF